MKRKERRDGIHGSSVNDGKPGGVPSRDSQNSHGSHDADPSPLLPPRGDYRTLLSYQEAEVVHETTDRFRRRFLNRSGRTFDQTFRVFREFVGTRPAGVVGNVAVCPIHRSNFLLNRRLQALGEVFVQRGGFRERMTRARLQARRRREGPG